MIPLEAPYGIGWDGDSPLRQVQKEVYSNKIPINLKKEGTGWGAGPS